MKYSKIKNPSNRNGGFTLIELAIVLVIIGIIIGAILKGQELINNTKSKRFQNDLKNIESMLWTYFDRKGRWPGDCDIDGIVEFSPANASTTATALSSTTDPAPESCDAATPSENQDAPFADLRSARVATYSTPNSLVAKHIMNGSFFIGQADDAAGSGERVNVIVAYSVPVWIAKMLDVSFDGSEDGSAGRIRRWDTAVAGAAWPSEASSDAMVSLAYMFDRVLP